MITLNQNNLESIKINKFSYKREDLKVGIVHIGLGRFHRGHQAIFNDLTLDQNFGPWGIAGVSLRSATSLNQLESQDFLYTVVQENKKARIVGCLKNVYYLGNGLSPIIEIMSAQETKIISLTITEKGYHYDFSKKGLDLDSPDIKSDLISPQNPKSSVGILALALFQRFKKERDPLTFLSCDNLSDNGLILKTVIYDYIEKSFPQISSWLEKNTSFPNTMIDRIVPSLTPEQLKNEEKKLNYVDNSLIKTEDFGQWVIEDNFVNSRPAWESAGVEFVRDVSSYEKMKLTLLNGTHSYLAYMGTLKGYKFVDQAIADPEVLNDVEQMLFVESSALLERAGDEKLIEYGKSLLKRYRNIDLKHNLLQISMDGSLKIPQRWIPALLFNLKRGLPIGTLVKAIAAWALFCEKSIKDQKWVLNDPKRELIEKSLRDSDSDIIDFLKSLNSIFPDQLMNNSTFTEEFRDQYQKLKKAIL